MRRFLPALSLLLLVAATPAAASNLAEEIAKVEKIRGLGFRHEVRTVTVGRAEITERLRAQIGKTMPYSLDDYFLVLRSLHLVDGENEALEAKLFSLLEQQVLAWYDPHGHVYYAVDETPENFPSMVPASMIAIHELTHALQDQHFDIGRRDLALRDDWDASLAYHAVIEGEATLVMMAALVESFGASLDEVVRTELFTGKLLEAAGAAGAIDPSAPSYFVESLKFPYLAGLTLVVEAYKRGGWKAVGALHADPPRSTREVLHLDEYFRRVESGSPPALPFRQPAAARSRLAAIRLGEFHWDFLLGDTSGWRSDEVTIVQNAACEPTVLVTAEWDSEADAAAFAGKFEAFLSERAPRVRLVRQGTKVRAAWGADRTLIAGFVR
ncbi:MAG TPA: hypothetical protein VNL91_02055 [Thermoanaerobaculia bacterium]|nr:hypothetical protein [Thermoanaerobaculia bacterium]